MQNWNEIFEKNHKKFLFVCLIIFLLFSSFHLGDNYIEDEAIVASAGSGVANTGKPTFYSGEGDSDSMVAEHPPLLVYLTGLVFLTAGEGESQARVLMVALAVLNIIMVFSLAIVVFREHYNRYTIAVISSFIYAFNPLTLQGSLAIDTETGLLVLGMSGFLLLFFRIKDSMTALKLTLLGFAFGAVLWAKLSTPNLLLISIFLYYSVNRKYKTAVFIPSVIAIIGFLFFSISWYLLSHTAGLNYSMPYDHTLSSILGAGSRGFGNELSDAGRSVRLFIFWVTPFTVYFGQLAIRTRLQKARRIKKAENIDLVLIIGLMIFILYTAFAPENNSFPKSYATMLPFLSVLVAYCICQINYFKEPSGKIFISFFLIFIISLIIMVFILGDPNLGREGFGSSILVIMKYVVIFFTAMFILRILYKYFSRFQISLKDIFFITVVICLASSNIYINIIQADAEYSVRYNYGEEGFDEVMDFIKENTNDTSVIIAPNDLGYYSDRRYYEASGSSLKNIDVLNETVLSGNISLIVLRYEGAYGWNQLPEGSTRYIQENFVQVNEDEFHDFIVFVRT